jgi:tetratricopeptide (TPR) repeat protein
LRLRIFVLAVALVAFGAAPAGSFHYDDFSLFADPLVSSPRGWYEVFEPLHTRPLTYLTFWLNYQAGGTAAWGYLLVNLLLHLGCALLAFECLRRMLDRPETAAVAAALFAANPVQAEAVNYVFARTTLLMALFCLLSLREWLRSRDWAAVAWFAAALLCKEEAVAFPLFLAGWSRDRRRWKPLAAMLALAAVAGLRTVWAARAIAGSGAGAQAGISPLDYASMQGIAILRYLRLLVLPWGFTPDPDLGSPAPWLRGAAWATVLGLLWWQRRNPWVTGAALLLAPTSTFLPAADLAVDRRMYLPLFALAPVAARFRFAGCAILIFAAVSLHYTVSVWRTDESLWRNAVRRAPAKTRPLRQLARTVAPAEATGLLEKAKGIQPDDPGVASDLGRMYLRTGRPGLALPEFGRALAAAPSDPMAISNRAAALVALGDAATARSEYRRALGIDPCFADALFALKQLGDASPIPPGCRFSAEVQALLDHRQP